MTVYYNAVDDEIVLKDGKWIYAHEICFSGVLAQNYLFYARWKIDFKQWKKALQQKKLVRLGRL